VKIHYVEKGAGEPVVLVHGFSADHLQNWVLPGVFDKLAADYRVIAIDNRGHGKSDKLLAPEDYGDKMVEDIVRLLDHLEIAQAHVVGYSMGGFLTNRLRAKHPERLLSATLGGAGWMKAGDEGESLREQLAVSLENGKGITPLIIALTPAGRPQPTEQELAFINQLLMLKNDPKALAAVIRGMTELQLTQAEIEANKVPTLAVIGSLDPLKAGVDRLDGVMPNLKIVVIDQADHMTAFAHPLFVNSIKEFLAAKSPQPAAATVGN
jgi:pimeloyl-ACP methyl ester carboxylesterase